MKTIITFIILMVILFYSISAFSQIDSTRYNQYVADRNRFVQLQETVSSKNTYIGLQWCIDLLNKYIQIEQELLNRQKQE